MVTLTVLLIIFFVLLILTVIAALTGGIAGLIVFGDIIVASLIIGFIIKLIVKK